jgi:hypothetical protein
MAFELAQLNENAEVGTAVGIFTTTDGDAGDTHTYSLVAGDGDSGNGLFAIVGSELTTAAQFDFEAQSSFSIRVRTTDSQGSSLETSVVIPVEDVNEPPSNISLNGTYLRIVAQA